MPRWTMLLLWAATIASAGGWGWALFGSSQRPPLLPTLARNSPNTAAIDWGRVLGVEAPVQVAAAPAADATRYRLVGVIAPSTPGAGFKGLAVIAVDEKPARAFRTDAEIAPDRFLKEVSLRGAAIGPRGGPASIHLELALLPPPATGTLPGPVSAAASGADAAARRPRSPTGGSRLQLSAPNVLLDNPADMAPADAGGSQSLGPQDPSAVRRSDR